MMTIGCPACGGAIRCTIETIVDGLKITLDHASAAWHVANCYSPPPPGDREVIEAGDQLLLDWDEIAGSAA